MTFIVMEYQDVSIDASEEEVARVCAHNQRVWDFKMDELLLLPPPPPVPAWWQFWKPR